MTDRTVDRTRQTIAESQQNASHPFISAGGADMEQPPLYKSQCSAKNFWREYRIFDDRVELETFFKTITVPLSDVEGIEVAHNYSEGVRLQLRRGMGLKLDWADFHQHVVLDKATGSIRHFAFTPDDPEAFRSTLETALARHRGEGVSKG
jgi:hypothetical protein